MDKFEKYLKKIFSPLHFKVDEYGRKFLKREWYWAVEVDYKNTEENNSAETQESYGRWLAEMSKMFGRLPLQSRYLCGGLGIAALVDDFSQPETATDLAMLGKRDWIEMLVKIANENGYYLMRRLSGKTGINSPFKFHAFYPATINDAFGENDQARRNLELTRIESSANMFAQSFTPRDHIKLHIHLPLSGNEMKCLSDWKHPITYPYSYFRGKRIEINEAPLYVLYPEYMLKREQHIIETGESKHAKHLMNIRKIEGYLALQLKEC